MFANLSYYDRLITQWINSLIPHNPFFDALFSFLSLKTTSIALWITIVLILAFFKFKKDRIFMIYFFAATGLTLFFNNIVLKQLFERHRPLDTLVTVSDICPKDFSFPSGHASTAFAAAFTLASFDKKRVYLYYILALLIGISRIYLGCHYAYDVFAGAMVGLAVGFTVLKIGKKLSAHDIEAPPKHSHGTGKRD